MRRRLTDIRFWMSAIRALARLAKVRFLEGRPLLLFIRNSGIGDIICTFPSLQQLRRSHPNAYVIFVVRKDFLPIAKASRLADLVAPSDSAVELLARRFFKTQLVFRPNLPDERFPKQPRHPVHLITEMQRSLELPEVLAQPKLFPSDEALARTQSFLENEGASKRPLVLFHRGPTWPVKEWPTGHWQSLAFLFGQKPGPLIAEVGSHRGTDGAIIDRASLEGVRDWRGKVSLDDLIALISQASLLIGIDSGLLHIAGAVGTPTIGLFGPTLPHCFMPIAGENAFFSAEIPCIGCHHHPNGPLHSEQSCPYDIECMRSIEPGAVFHRALPLLSHPSPSRKLFSAAPL